MTEDAEAALPVARWLGAAGRLFLDNPGPLLWLAFLAMAGAAIVGIGPVFIMALLDTSPSSSGDTSFGWDVLLGGDLFVVLGYLVSGGLASIPAAALALSLVRGDFPSLHEALHPHPYWGRMLGYGVLWLLSVTVGLMLCVVPGLIVAALLLPVPALLADGLSVRDAVTQSVQAMRPTLLPAAGLGLVLLLLTGGAFLPCGLGLLWAQPLCWLVSALAARERGLLSAPLPPSVPDYGSAEEGVWPPPPTLPPPF